MLKNYFKIGFRNIRKDVRFSTINLLGLSVGLSVFILMILMIHHELTFDRFHSRGDRIYEVIQEFEGPQGLDPEIYTALPLASTLREEMAVVENAVTIHSAASGWFSVGGERFFEEGGIIAGSQFFEIFDFGLTKGSESAALTKSRSIVLSRSLASKFFQDENPIGKIVDIERYGLFTVTGILEEIPANSLIQFDFVITQDYDIFFEHVAPWFPQWFQSWNGDPAATFVLLREGQDPENFEGAIQPILAKYMQEEEINRHYLINLFDLHFGLAGVDGRVGEYIKGDIRQLRIFIIISVLILGMACFNYINITTARSARRLKEVGIRKSVGAHRNQVIAQFLVESFLLVISSMVLSLLVVFYALPIFNEIVKINLELTMGNLWQVLPFLILTLILVTLFSGLYPSLVMSRLTAIKTLNRSGLSVRGNQLLRNTLVVIQFVLVIGMAGLLAIINQQYQYLSAKSMGFDTDQLLVVEINGGGVRSNFTTIKSELKTYPEVSQVTGMTRMIGGYRGSVNLWAGDHKSPDDGTKMRFYGMDEDGLKTLGLKMLKGKNFTGNYSEDSTSVLLNELAAVKLGGFDVVGQYIDIFNDDGVLKARVVGIVRDFHYESLHDAIGPVVIGHYFNIFQGIDDIVIRLSKGADVQESLAKIELLHHKYDENDVMTWQFMDDMLQQAYEKEMIFREVLFIASVVSLLISILGVIGIVSFNVINRTKELGIRKVLGASLGHLFILQGRNTFLLILISSLIAIPVSWILADNWLEGYAYRIGFSLVPYLAIVVLILFLTGAVVYMLGYKISKDNPVNSLRYE